MSSVSKELIRQLVKEERFGSTKDIMEAIKGMFKDVLQEAMEAELDNQLGYERYEKSESSNRRNGHSKKTLKSEFGELEIAIPRDRNGEYEPKLIPKHSRSVEGLEEKVISLYAAGLSTRDIHTQIKELYGVEISAEQVSRITDRVLPLLQEWQSRPLETSYPFVFMDAIHYKVRDEKQIVSKAAYVVLGINKDGYKEVLGIWIGQAESSKFWLTVLNELRNRGVRNVNVFCVDGLNGFKEAINATFPDARVQRCIIHQIRSSTKYVSYTDIKEFISDLKAVYGAASEEEALFALENLRDKWGKKYPSAVKSWEQNWDVLATFFIFSPEIRKIIYTTNAIEALHRQFRKVTKTKAVFPSDQSLYKMLYLATDRIQQKWTMRYRGWDQTLSQLEILFDSEAV
jgi:transposase-like protein